MKTLSLKSTTIACFLFLSIISCKKEDEATPNTGGNTNTTAGSFEWQENGGAKLTADSAYYTTGSWGTGIRAYKNGMANFFEINWDGTNNTTVGAKVIPFANFGFAFLKGTDSYTIRADQNLNITATGTNTITGNFTMAVTGGPITTIVASFNALPKK